MKKDKLVHPPPLNEGEALASRILELGPAKAQFLGPVIIEVSFYLTMGEFQKIIHLLSSPAIATCLEYINKFFGILKAFRW